MTNETEDKTSKNDEKEPNLSEEDQVRQKELDEDDKETQHLFKSLAAQKEHWRDKHNKLQSQVEELKKQVSKEEEKEEKEEKGEKKEDRLNKIEFAVAHRDLDAEDIEEVSVYALGKGISLEEAFKSGTMQSAIKAKQEKARQEQSTPSPSTRSPRVGKKAVSDLSHEELEKNFKEVVEKVTRAKR